MNWFCPTTSRPSVTAATRTTRYLHRLQVEAQPEGRSQNTTWYHEFKKMDVGDVSGDDVTKINPGDAKSWGSRTATPSALPPPPAPSSPRRSCGKGAPGTIAKCYGQGHWAYGRVAAKDYAKAQPRRQQ